MQSTLHANSITFFSADAIINKVNSNVIWNCTEENTTAVSLLLLYSALKMKKK